MLRLMMSVSGMIFLSRFVICCLLCCLGGTAAAQDRNPDVPRSGLSRAAACANPANAESIDCLFLPEAGRVVTNFVPLIAPLIGAAALAGLGGSTAPATSTTSTTQP